MQSVIDVLLDRLLIMGVYKMPKCLWMVIPNPFPVFNFQPISVKFLLQQATIKSECGICKIVKSYWILNCNKEILMTMLYVTVLNSWVMENQLYLGGVMVKLDHFYLKVVNYIGVLIKLIKPKKNFKEDAHVFVLL